MHNEGYYYSYVACYCYDMIVVHNNPDNLFDSIRVKGFIIKQTSYPDYFLGGYFELVKDPKINNEIMIWASKK